VNYCVMEHAYFPLRSCSRRYTPRLHGHPWVATETSCENRTHVPQVSPLSRRKDRLPDLRA